MLCTGCERVFGEESDSVIVVIFVRLGIIGEPLSLFDPMTLTSLEPDEHTEE